MGRESIGHMDTPVTCQAPWMAYEWSYSKSSIKDQQTKGLQALKVPDQLSSCSLGLINKYSVAPSLTWQLSICAWEGFSFYLQFEGSWSLFHASDLMLNQFLSNIYTCYIYFYQNPIPREFVQPMKFIVWPCENHRDTSVTCQAP